ncbi:hypothetical protein [Pseudomonas sp. DSP3-2-2]|uniref:hypothetical protein n=1 Tax=unclassified Pseudomonas TaxID=196821 RepID=UPI003CF788E2
MDVKSRLISKINAKVADEKQATADREHALNSFLTEWSELTTSLTNLAKEIPELKSKVLSGAVDGTLFHVKSLSLSIFGHSIEFEACKENNRFGVSVTGLWSRPTFLVTDRMNHWVAPARADEQMELTEDKILERLTDFVDKPAVDQVKLWD